MTNEFCYTASSLLNPDWILNFFKKIIKIYSEFWALLVAQIVKNLPAMQETQVWSLGKEDPLEKGMTTHSSILAWRIPWTEEPCGLQSLGSQRVRHDWKTNTFTVSWWIYLTMSWCQQLAAYWLHREKASCLRTGINFIFFKNSLFSKWKSGTLVPTGAITLYTTSFSSHLYFRN